MWRSLFLLFLLFIGQPALADTFTTPYIFTPGTVIQSSQVNANFAYISNFFNTPYISAGNIKSGAAILPTQMDLTKEYPILRATANRCFSAGNTGDTVYRCTITSDGYIQWGPGGGSALDTMLKREGAAILGVLNAAGSSYGQMNVGNIHYKTASNDLIETAASIATANRTVTKPDPGANVDAVYKTSGATATAGGIAYGTGNHTLNFGAAGTAGQLALSGGSGAPTWSGSGTNGQLLIGQTGSSPTYNTVTGDVTITSGGVTSIKSNVALAGNPTTTTQAAADNSTKIATTAYVDSAVTGGVGAVQVAHVLLSSAQIKALHTTAITLVSAPGSGYAVVPIDLSWRINFVTTAYSATNTGIGIGYGDEPRTGIGQHISYINGSSPSILTEATKLTATYWGRLVFDNDAGGSNATVGNQPIKVGASLVNPVTGDSTLDLWMTYFTVGP